ncbi:hypothetical protein K438DRAFT_1821487 [Mycena galopus ATCC 62051]|nr:hypothetical protein K438DRAFT_1821487 [Mycena galopus ATCC 62051]
MVTLNMVFSHLCSLRAVLGIFCPGSGRASNRILPKQNLRPDGRPGTLRAVFSDLRWVLNILTYTPNRIPLLLGIIKVLKCTKRLKSQESSSSKIQTVLGDVKSNHRIGQSGEIQLYITFNIFGGTGGAGGDGVGVGGQGGTGEGPAIYINLNSE